MNSLDNVINVMNNNMAYIVSGMALVILILLILLIINMVKISKMKKKYNSFMQGKDAKSLEDTLLKRLDEVDVLKEDAKVASNNIKALQENLKLAYQKIGIVKYDAFKEMGGKLSFSVALLDDNNDGFIINAMHSREGCYTYIKEIVKGESYIILGDEEKQALEIALNESKAVVVKETEDKNK